MNDYPIIDYKNVDKVIIFIEMTNFRSRDTLYFDIIADKNLVHASKNIHSRTNILFSFSNISCWNGTDCPPCSFILYISFY